MRVCEVFNSILGLDQATVSSVEVDPDGRAGVVVTLAVTGPHRCGCGTSVASRYDSTTRRWRHLDVAGRVLWLQARLARIWCPNCARVVTEEVSWARPGARYSREFEQHVAWLAQRMDLSAVARLMRCGWDAIHRIVGRVVADQLVPGRFDGLARIGVDEVSYRRGRRFLTVVIDHDRRRVVWVGVGKSKDTLAAFYTEIGPERAAKLRAVSMDGSPAFRSATLEAAGQARICLDPFHVMKWANEALEKVFTDSRVHGLRTQLRTITGQHRSPNHGWTVARHVIRAGREKLTATHHQVLGLLRRERGDLHRAWTLKEELRDLFAAIDPDLARAYLTEWIARARRSGIRPFFVLANRLDKLADAIAAGVEEGLSNARLEGTNTRIRVIQRRGYGMPNPQSLIGLIYLCCGGLDIALPTRT